MKYLDAVTWLRFGIWLAIGVVIYAAYGYWHSRLRDDDGDRPGETEANEPAPG